MIIYTIYTCTITFEIIVITGFGEDGDILVERSKYSKVKSVTNMEEWSEGFLNYINILLKRFPVYEIRGVFCVTLCPPVAANCNHN
jgi:hypothetical protein